MLTDEGVISLDVRMCFFKKFQFVSNLRFVQRKTCRKESKNFDIKIFLKSEKCIWLVLCNLKNLEKFESKNSNVLWWALNWSVFYLVDFNLLVKKKCLKTSDGFRESVCVCVFFMTVNVMGVSLKVWIKSVSWVLLKSKRINQEYP